jgi:aldose 1-epimerase
MREIGSPSGAQWQITAGDHRAVVVEVGGGLRSYTVGDEPILDGYEADEIAPGSAGEVLVPWPNRIRDGLYTFNGESHQLSLSEPARNNAMHGLTRWARWQRIDVAPDRVSVAYDVPPQPGYPWALHLVTTWSIGPDGLRADHEATNLSGKGAPFGLGVHPYLHVAGVAVDDLQLTVPAQRRLLVDGRMLPIGAAKVAGGPYDFTEPRRIGEAQLDSAFGDVVHDGEGVSTVRLETADGTRGREVWADGSFQWWQVFTGDTLIGDRFRRSVAVEPMTCPPDAFRSGRDVVTIAPGETWQGSWGIRVIGV